MIGEKIVRSDILSFLVKRFSGNEWRQWIGGLYSSLLCRSVLSILAWGTIPLAIDGMRSTRQVWRLL